MTDRYRVDETAARPSGGGASGARTASDQPDGDRPGGDRPGGDRPGGHRPVGGAPGGPVVNDDPYAPPTVDVRPTRAEAYPGIGRLIYFAMTCLFIIAQGAFGGWFVGRIGNSVIALAILTALLVVPTVLRLRNIGQSGWWSILILIPLINLVLWLRCVAFPTGYRDTGRLDGPGKVILWSVFLFLMFVFGLGLFAVLNITHF